MSARLTPTGWLFLGIVGLLYVASITSQSGLLLVPPGILLGCFAVNFLTAWRTVRSLELSAPPEANVVEGQRLNQPSPIRGVAVVATDAERLGDHLHPCAEILLRLSEHRGPKKQSCGDRSH